MFLVIVNWTYYIQVIKDLYYNGFVLQKVGRNWLWTYLGDEDKIFYTTSNANKYLQTFVEYKVPCG